MKNHLSDVEFSDLLLEETAPRREHLEACAMCRVEHERLASELTALRNWTLASADLPEHFWAQQRRVILSRTQQRSALESLRWALAAGLALVAVATLLFSGTPSIPQQARVDPDHLLLLEVEQSLQRPVPRALAPADLLAQEVSRTRNQSSNP
jgi:predicted anti-sigma-YlaC factor YlaD